MGSGNSAARDCEINRPDIRCELAMIRCQPERASLILEVMQGNEEVPTSSLKNEMLHKLAFGCLSQSRH